MHLLQVFQDSYPAAFMANSEKKIPDHGLTPKQLIFFEHYLVLRNGLQAAVKAGYSKKTAQEKSSRLLSNVKAKAYIEAKTDKILDRLEITQERVIREYARLGLSDIRSYWYS